MKLISCMTFITLFPACGTDAPLLNIGCRLRRVVPARSGRGADPRGELCRRLRHGTSQRAVREFPTRVARAAAAAAGPPLPSGL
jgi:hypothetical protein